MGLVPPCLSFPIGTQGTVGRKARVGASPFPTASPAIRPGHLDTCGVQRQAVPRIPLCWQGQKLGSK